MVLLMNEFTNLLSWMIEIWMKFIVSNTETQFAYMKY